MPIRFVLQLSGKTDPQVAQTDYWANGAPVLRPPTATTVTSEGEGAVEGAQVIEWTDGVRALAVFLLRAHVEKEPTRFRFRSDEHPLAKNLANALHDATKRDARGTWLQKIFLPGSDVSNRLLPDSLFHKRTNYDSDWFSVRLGKDWENADFQVQRDAKPVDHSLFSSLAEELEAAREDFAPIPRAELDGQVTLRVWDRVRGHAIPAADNQLPLHTGAELMVQVNLNRPAFVYLIWMTSGGRALPLYPWESFDWTTPLTGKKTRSLLLPLRGAKDNLHYYPLDTGLGTETVVLLARDQRLLPDFSPRLERLFRELAKDFGTLELVDPRCPFPFQCASTATLAPSATRLGSPQPVDDPFLNLRRRLGETLGPRFSLIKGVCFANAGEARGTR